MREAANREVVTRSLPAVPGTYALIFALSRPLGISVGRLGNGELRAGNQIYIGSAHGPGGLRARVGRHLRSDKRAHWHVDALIALVPIASVWFTTSAERLECEWSAALASMSPASEPIPGFGASDCACRTHLYSLPPHMLKIAWQQLGEPTQVAIS